MLKNNSLLAVVYGVLFLIILLVLYISRSTSINDTLIFSYPAWTIRFADESVPMDGKNFDNKKRFDKEFILTSNNLYQFYLYVKRYPLYIPYISEELKKNNIPEDFVYLPIAESALREDVVSSAGAAWIWQFMPDTAREYGLIVDDAVDERYRFDASTQSAIAYLKDLYKKFWNWTLVAAAYNRWGNGLARDMESQGITNYYDLYLNNETSRYVFRILAIKYVMEDYFSKKEMIDTLIGGVYELPNTTTIEVWQIDDLQIWAQQNDYNYKDIKLLNPWIIGNTLPQGEWEITVLQ